MAKVLRTSLDGPQALPAHEVLAHLGVSTSKGLTDEEVHILHVVAPTTAMWTVILAMSLAPLIVVQTVSQLLQHWKTMRPRDFAWLTLKFWVYAQFQSLIYRNKPLFKNCLNESVSEAAGWISVTSWQWKPETK